MACFTQITLSRDLRTDFLAGHWGGGAKVTSALALGTPLVVLQLFTFTVSYKQFKTSCTEAIKIRRAS